MPHSRSFPQWFMGLILSAIVIVIIAAASLNLFLKSVFENMPQHAMLVELGQIEERARSQKILSTGTLFNDNQSVIRSLVSAPIESLFVHTGERIEQGAIAIELDAHAARAQLDATKAALKYAQYRFEQDNLLFKDGALPEVRLRESFYNLSKAQSFVAEAEERLQHYQIQAPQSGIIGHLEWLKGDTVLASETIMSIFDPRCTRLKTALPAALHNYIKPGQKVTARALSGEIFDATIDKVAPELSEPAQRFWVEAALDSTIALPPGSVVNITFHIPQENSTLIVPISALDVNPLGPIIWVAKKDGDKLYAEPYPCQVLASQEEVVTIAHPSLKADMQIVLVGQFKLRPGQEIVGHV